MNPKNEQLCILGQQLAKNEAVLFEVKSRASSAFDIDRKTQAGLNAYWDAWRETANIIGIPDELRDMRHLTEDVNYVIRVAERYVRQKKLAIAATGNPDAEFFVGMVVLCHFGIRTWLEGTVEKLHSDGQFTFRYPERAKMVDPHDCTVKLI